jgi:hypothetical protein
MKTARSKTLPGRDLEQLVEMIERAIQGNSDVLVESPKRLRDRDTRRLREHDVVLTITRVHHKIVVAVECKDRSRKVGVSEVEAFAKKCERTGVHAGLMVSSLGFTLPALLKAENYNINCLTLTEASQVNWCDPGGIELRWREISDITAIAYPERGDLVAPIRLYWNSGEEIGPTERRQLVHQSFQGVEMEEPSDDLRTRTFADPTPGMFLVDARGQRQGCRLLRLKVTYTVKSALIPFEFHEYTDLSADEKISEAAIARLVAGDFRGNLVLTKSEAEGGEINVSLQPPRRAKSSTDIDGT